MHRDDAADGALERFGARDNPEFVRKKVTLWLGDACGARGFEAVTKIARDDSSDEVRKSAMFGLSQSSDARSVPERVRFARQDASPKVRSKDPDTDVKKRAASPSLNCRRTRDSAADESREDEPEPRRAKAGDVLARPITGPESTRVLAEVLAK